MTTDNLTQIGELFMEHLTLTDWAKGYSAFSWNYLSFARRTGRYRALETTLTDLLLLSFYTMASERLLPVEIFQSIDERANGSDIEFFLEEDGKFISVPCQAKITDKYGKYARFNHRVGGVLQLDLLLAYARRQAGFPIYLLYNFALPQRGTMDWEQYESLMAYGCTFLSAETLRDEFCINQTEKQDGKKCRMLSFYDLHPALAFPFCELFSGIGNPGTIAIPGVSLQKLQSLRRYTYEEITGGPTWEDMSPPRSLGRIPREDHNMPTESIIGSEDVNFNPKFRIIFRHQLPRIALYRLS